MHLSESMIIFSYKVLKIVTKNLNLTRQAICLLIINHLTGVSNSRLYAPIRIDGSNDDGQKFGGGRDSQIRLNAGVGPIQSEVQRLQQSRRQD